MSSCCPADVRVVSTVMGNTITHQYFDLTGGEPALITKAAYDAMVKVKCPEVSQDFENVCLQLVGNTDASLIESGEKLVITTVTYSDTAGAIDTVTRAAPSYYLEDGTDVTATHEVVACPVATVIESDHCVKP